MKPLCVVSCPIDTFSGYGARSRDFVKSLIKSKGEEWDILIVPQSWGDCPWKFLSIDDPLRQRFVGNNLPKQPDIWIQITVPNEFQRVGKFNIGISAGIETTIYPVDFIEGSNRMDLNIVSSEHSKRVALASQYEQKENNQVKRVVKLEKPIEVLFEGLDLEKYYKDPSDSSILGDIPEEFCFLYTGHWIHGDLGEDRKNTGLLIKTFLETFKGLGNKKPALILKTNRINYSLLDREDIISNINKIRDMVKGSLPNIYLLHGEMTDEEMNRLNNDPKVKAFLSFTKGEGYGRPLAEAAITGKPILTTNWSGHIDFLHPEYTMLIGGKLTNVHKSSANKFLLKESQWFSIDTEIASRAMKALYKKYKTYLEKSRKQTQHLKDNFSFNKMTEKLGLLLPKVSPTPQMQQLNLPKLKKVSDSKPELPKIKLPKLKKIKS